MALVRSVCRLVFLSIVVTCIPSFVHAQYAEQNVNMVSGTQWPGGDPFLRQQNEPSLAVSTRNPLHLVAGANDYRSVDIPFSAPARPDDEETGDAWLGIFRSKDGGNTWRSTLLDGYPQQANSVSPLHGYQAAADPVVRAGNNGMFYYAGIVLNRGDNPLGGVFVARLIDNNTEVLEPVSYIDAKLIDKGTSGQFIDKPWFAVAPMTNGGQCTVNGQTFPAQNLYLAYSVFVGNDNNIKTRIMFTRSTDCGATWAMPQKLSETYHVNQGVSIAVDPTSGAVYVGWRRFAAQNDPHSIVMTKSTNGGGTFTKGAVIANINPFEQGTTAAGIRTNAYPAIAVDNSGRVYVAWSQRNAVTNDGQIVLMSSPDGLTGWTAPMPVAPAQGGTSNGRGHQFMPAMTFSSGKLTLAWYDLRDDQTIAKWTEHSPFDGTYDSSRILAGNLFLNQPQVVFWQYLADVAPSANSPKLVRRHTLDVYAAESNGGLMPPFSNAARITRYKFGSFEIKPPTNPKTYSDIQDLQIDPPNLPMFRQGTVPFLGDYIDITAYAATPASARVRHVVWTDNRDVRVPPGSPPNWTIYTPVQSPALGNTSIFDPTQHPPQCVADQFGNAPGAGSRNQNIYTTRVTDGLFAGSPTNTKATGSFTRAFAVFVQNTRGTLTSFHLAIVQAGVASFTQFAPFVTQIDINVPPHSTSTRTVFVNAPPKTKVDVNITENGGPLTTVVGLNPDPTTPDIGNPDIGNNEVFNPDIGNPDIGNPDIGNPDIGNPDIGNPDIGNPDIGNPDIGNPDIGNPDIGNPDIGNPDIGNPDIGNGSVTDTTWTAHNNGNTTGGYTVKLLKNGDLPPGVKSQLILNKIYDTPVARGCNLGVEHVRQIVSSINDPKLSDFGEITDPSLTDSSDKIGSLWLAAGEAGRITVRLIDPVHKGLTLDASAFVTPVVIAHSVNTADAARGVRTPPTSLLAITTKVANDAVTNRPYSTKFDAIGGVPPYHWFVNVPETFTIDNTGLLTGTFTQSGGQTISVTVTDSATPPHNAGNRFGMNVVDRLDFAGSSILPAVQNAQYSASFGSIGGFAPIHWTLASGSLPAGLTLSDGGTIGGVATTLGTSQFTLTITDSSHPAQTITSALLHLDVVTPPALQFVTQPHNAASGQNVSDDLIVKAVDATGAVLPGVQITLSQPQQPCAPGVRWNDGSLPMTRTTDATGQAHFGNLPAFRGCYGFVLNASALNVTSATSTPFDVFGFGDFPSMNAGHFLGTVTKLADGRILVAGGLDVTTGLAVNTAEVYNPQTNAWTLVGNMAIPRLSHTATQLPDGRVLIAGGRSDTQTYPTLVEYFNPVTNTFATTGLNIATGGRAEHTATLTSDGRVVFIGGRQGNTWLTSIQEWISNDIGTLSGSLAFGRTGHTATLLGDGRIVIVGGGVLDPHPEIEILATNGSVSSGGTAQVARAAHSATLLGNGRIFIAGGSIAGPNGNIETLTSEIYDPASATSVAAASMPNEHASHAAQLIAEGFVVLAGGTFSTGPNTGAATTAVDVYVPGKDNFQTFGNLATAMTPARAVPLDATPGKFLVMGGLGTSVEVFYPPR